jgi:ppGpp synthetase/RelA/SpoT-type nucleotidyltranferase
MMAERAPDPVERPGTIEWAQSQVDEYAARRPDYVRLGQALEEVLRYAAAEYAPLAIVSVRAKGIPSFAEKCLRKAHKYSRPADQLTDLCGARIIVHTQAQVERISQFLEEHFEIDWANTEDAGKRLKTSEFGYRSVHYIVTFRPGVFPTRLVPVRVPARLYGGPRGMKNPRAEVQVRTVLQHAWADTGHDLLYKGGFEAPEVWKREFARLAAVLETADGAIGRVHADVHRFLSSYRAYLTPEQMSAELDLLDFVRVHDPDDVDLALRIGGIANAAERWDTSMGALEAHASPEHPAVLRELGIACCGKGGAHPRSALYRRGQRLLEQAAADPDTGAAAQLPLAASWRGVDDGRARAGYTRAFEVLPDDPHALAGYLEYEISFARDLDPMTAAGPAVAAALVTCRSRVRAGVDIPGAHFTAGFLQLLSGKPFEALDSYAKGVERSGAGRQVGAALDSLQRIGGAVGNLVGHGWAVRLLQLGLAARHPTKAALAVVRSLATSNASPLRAPVVVVAGGCDPARAQQFEGYGRLLRRGLADFSGTLIGGGTRQGVSGFVGDAAERNPRLHAVSYLPRLLPLDASRDERYSDVRAIDDAGFTPMGPLQAWTDLIAAGIDPAGVRLLGINGGPISAAEYRVALALGATVGVMEGSGREAARLLPDERWGSSPRLLSLPADAASVRAFVGGKHAVLPEGLREAVARDLHAEFRGARVAELRPDEPGLAEWDALLPEYRDSAMLQADDIAAKLALVGRELVASEHPIVRALPDAEVELLAEMEHGRWAVERLLGGWRWGPTKDVKARVSPYLVPWEDLPEPAREWDRVFIRALPETLARYGYEVRNGRRGEGGGEPG